MASVLENGGHAPPTSVDSEDDDLPLGQLLSKKEKGKEAAEEGVANPAVIAYSSSANPAVAPKKEHAVSSSSPSASSSSAAIKKERPHPVVQPKVEAKGADAADEEDDDDDDLPIAALLTKSSDGKATDAGNGKKRKRPEEENGKSAHKGGGSVGGGSKDGGGEKKKKVVVEERADRPSRKTEVVAKPVKAKSSRASSKDSHHEVSQRFFDLTKGELVQKLLCRWWYAITWPDPNTIKAPPPDYESLEGYPGVFVCVRGDQIGHVLDRRRMDECPNFTNLSKKPADELKTLLKKALEEQLRQLKEHEGSNKKLEKRIKKELEWTDKVNAKKADDEARKHGFPVPNE